MVFIDIETTGLHLSSDRVVKITLLRLHPDGKEEFISSLLNPGIPIPEEATLVQGIRDSDLLFSPDLKEMEL